jgi:mannose-6-phosphate isomerase-like protein (cupin superfamily)
MDDENAPLDDCDKINLNPALGKEEIYQNLLANAAGHGLSVHHELCASDTPWGAYVRLREECVQDFLTAYWSDVRDEISVAIPGRLAPKLLLVAPESRLSLQYHHRRREYWRVLAGPVKIVLGADGSSLKEQVYEKGDLVKIPCTYWHRIAGLTGWSVIAELWEHIDPENPSDEDDIIRVEDDFNRKTG